MLARACPMITAGTDPPIYIYIDLGNDESRMTLQYRDVERGYIVWRDYTVDGEVVKSPLILMRCLWVFID